MTKPKKVNLATFGPGGRLREPSPGMTKQKKVILATMAILIIGFVAWLAWPKRNALAAMRRDLVNAPPDNAMQRWGELPFGQRRELGPQLMGNRMRKAAEEYYRLPPDKRSDYLDKQIAEQERRRREWEARRNQDGQAGGPGQGGQGQGGPGQGGQGQGGQGQGGRGRNASPEQRSLAANRALDRGSPSQRTRWQASWETSRPDAPHKGCRPSATGDNQAG